MSGYLEYMVFNFTSDKLLRDTGQLVRLTKKITEDGSFKIINPSTSNEYPPEQFVESIDEKLYQTWYQIIRDGQYGISLSFWDSTKAFEITIGIPSEHYRQIYLMVSSADISLPEPTNYRRIRSFIAVCEMAYEMLHPEYGYGLVTPKHLETPDENLHVIYDYNFIGPRLVQGIGKEDLMAIPAWRMVEYLDGGVFFEMTPRTLDRQEYLYAANYEIAAKKLNVKKYNQLGKVTILDDSEVF